MPAGGDVYKRQGTGMAETLPAEEVLLPAPSACRSDRAAEMCIRDRAFPHIVHGRKVNPHIKPGGIPQPADDLRHSLARDGQRNISPEQYIDGLEWRYACNKFDPEARLEQPTWHALAESLRLSPSSLGLQLWKFVVVTNREPQFI